MSSKKGRKRRHGVTDENRAECPFSVTTMLTAVDGAAEDTSQMAKKRKGDRSQDDKRKKTGYQKSPFKPGGRFETHENMDVHYVVEPRKDWNEVKAYNSFVLNGHTYVREDFVFVANDNTIELQKHGGQAILNPRASNCWVGQILEIRAIDPYHVYARIYWMYSPDELPPNTMGGKKMASGRQPYHGANELIASNHMDIINVVSVAMPATVNQLIETDDDNTQEALYWRQAFDIRTSEVSTVQLICKCEKPGNPDKTLVGCTDAACGTWMHHECLLDAVLTRVYDRLGTDRPHVEEIKQEAQEHPMAVVNAVEKGMHQQEPMSPRDIKDEETRATIDVKGGDNISQEPIQTTGNKITPPTDDPTPNQPASLTDIAASAQVQTPRKLAGGKKGRGKQSANAKPYDGLFEATLRLTEVPVTWDITDLRTGVEGVKTWTESAECLVCGTRIV